MYSAREWRENERGRAAGLGGIGRDFHHCRFFFFLLLLISLSSLLLCEVKSTCGNHGVGKVSWVEFKVVVVFVV